MTIKLKSSFLALVVPTAFMAALATLAAFPMGLSSIDARIAGSFMGILIALGILYLALKKEGATFRDYQLYYDKGTAKKFLIGFLLSLLIGGGKSG